MNTLQVPENISLRWEAWRGFGGPEFLKSSVVSGIALAVSIVLYKAKLIPLIFAVGLVIFTFAVCVSLLSKIEYNQSIVDYIAKAVLFRKEQQLFVYIKTGKGEVIPNGEETKKSAASDSAGIYKC
ncbi:MAG: hypothetical protein VB064_02310 [Oscillospiraceae bacterium]|nr:hypothetical protein [Oscillospiraceae bacterium]